MKVRTFKRFADDDYPHAPQWFLDHLDALNPMIDALNPLLANNIDIDNNMLAERQTVTLSHNTPIQIKLQKLKTTPFIVLVGYAHGYIGHGAITSYNNDGMFYVTVFFLGTIPTSPVSTTLVFLP
jgi:hypothetical protein